MTVDVLARARGELRTWRIFQEEAVDLPDTRLIEAAFPLRQVSRASVHEKSVRHGHLSILHAWLARRPLPGFALQERAFAEAFLKARG